MDNFGWILLHKCLLNWEWYKDINTKCLFIHCLLKANYSDNEWKGKIIKRGQFFTSLDILSHELNLSIKEIRGAIKKLEKTQELGIQGASNGTMITVCKYEDYQNLELLKGKQSGKQRANKGQAKGQQFKEELKEEELKETIIPLTEMELVFEKWLNYKTARRESYKTDDSKKLALDKLIKMSNNDHKKALEIIEQSMANNWSGMFELKNKTNGQPTNSNYYPVTSKEKQNDPNSLNFR